jgi:hypothetical protein
MHVLLSVACLMHGSGLACSEAKTSAFHRYIKKSGFIARLCDSSPDSLHNVRFELQWVTVSSKMKPDDRRIPYR